MIYQSKEYTCGPSSIVNALRCFGVNKSESTIARYCGTTAAKGTDQHGIRQGIARAGYSSEEWHDHFTETSAQWLVQTLLVGSPVILCVDDWEHWVCCTHGYRPGAVFLFDSAVNCANTAENGVHSMNIPQVMKRWGAKKKYTSTYEYRYYGIVVGGPLD